MAQRIAMTREIKVARTEKDQARLAALLAPENKHKKFAALYQKFKAGRTDNATNDMEGTKL